MRKGLLFAFCLFLACGGGKGEGTDSRPFSDLEKGPEPSKEIEGERVEVEALEDLSDEGAAPSVCEQLDCENTYKIVEPEKACFRWVCDEVRQRCLIQFLQGKPCDDGISCTSMDTCVDGRCVGLVNECDCSKGEGECSDGDPCTVGDKCTPDGRCAPGEPLDCSFASKEAGECRNVECFLGVCMMIPLQEGEPCTSPSKCFQKGMCDGRGRCLGNPNTEVSCDDGDPCTLDFCDSSDPDPAKHGCVHRPLDGVPCDDKNACTIGDTCQDGECKGEPLDCDDKNPCTRDLCDPGKGCQYLLEEDNTPCDDGDGCTPYSVCKEGLCVGEVKCDDGDQCTVDYCENKQCVHKQHFFACNDGDPCTVEDRCQEDGQCRGLPMQCPSDDCNSGKCVVEGGKGVCKLEPKPEGTKCNDGLGCTKDDECGPPDKDGRSRCVGRLVDCSDFADQCNDGVCIPIDATKYTCVKVAKAGKPLCDDGDPCTVGDYCHYGKCVSGAPLVCEQPQDPCEQSVCVDGKCVRTFKSGTCSDGNACTVGDVCVAGPGPDDPGQCVGTLLNCDDMNPCTKDYCDPQVGCRHIPRIKECSGSKEPCVTDLDCGQGEKCLEVSCEDDGNPCTRDVCGDDGTCRHLGRFKECQDRRPCERDEDCGPDGPCRPVPCEDDGNECTVDLCWWDGTCQHRQRVMACDDGIPCLSNSDCRVGTCKDRGPISCDDGDKCTLNDVCNLKAQCLGTPRDCTDYETLPSGVVVENVCTDDYCDQNNPNADPETGCYHIFNSNPCDDHDPCTRAEKCAGNLCDTCFFGHCIGPIERDCSDDNPCTLDGCDQFHPGADKNGCWHEKAPEGSPCNDKNLCTFNDKCDASGACKGEQVDCEDYNDCTEEVGCDPLNGCIRKLRPNGYPCDDANACTIGDRCYSGVCSGPNALNCDDSDPCTIDWCLPSGDNAGCQHTSFTCDDGLECTSDVCKGDGGCEFRLMAGWCLIDGACYKNGSKNPENECQACITSQSTGAWTNLAAGMPCGDDGVKCTDDYCNGLGRCVHPVQQDMCLIDGSCYKRGDKNPENDCQECNPSLSQTTWSNRPAGAQCTGDGTGDGNWCTVYQCDGLGSCRGLTAEDTCMINNVCYLAGFVNPENDCEECNPALSKSRWSYRPAGAKCTDDEISCTLDKCDGVGSCTHVVDPDWCLIDDSCYKRGQKNPQNDCEECNPSQSQKTWSSRPLGTQCKDDGDPCTVDQCDGAGSCKHDQALDKCKIEGKCYDGGKDNPQNPCQFCNPSVSRFSWTNKSPGTSCTADGIACTDDICDANGQCSHPVKQGYCLISGECYLAGTPKPGSQCQECDPTKNQTDWSNKANGTLCSDGNACTLNDYCFNGECISGTPKVCPPPGQCQHPATCNTSTGECEYTLKDTGSPCNDNDACTVNDKCDNQGRCKGDPLPCTDNNPCTEDKCDPGVGCYYPPLPDDTNCSVSVCAKNAVCKSGQCVGTLEPYGTPCQDDGVQCTTDICNGSGACTHPINSDYCLIGGRCYYTGESNPENSCQFCNPSVSQLLWSNKPSGVTCSPDAYDCTDDVCDGSGGCIHLIQTNKCLINDQCYDAGATQGQCLECDPATSQTSWTYKTGKPCDDGEPCTKDDQCFPGGSGCHGTPYSCTDQYSCTDDICDGNGGCSNPIQADKCLIGGTCYNAQDRNPANPCQECNPAQNQTEWLNIDGVPCNDNVECTVNDQCTGGVCRGSPDNSLCDDQRPCTDDICDSDLGCLHPIQTDKCLIGATCYEAHAINPANPCQECNPGQNQTDWSTLPDKTPCGDTNICCGGECKPQGSC